ncbi:MAG: thiamine-phosphate kinase [Clostridium sp.]|nr:thiamine-phosphate kinase [Clostridium sp.]
MDIISKEQQFLNVINNILSDNSYLGDDCAYLQELGIYVTHDSLVEGVHFLLSTTDAYNLGRKAASVNLSDLAAAGAKPLYLTISLSCNDSVDVLFVEDFYKGINDVCSEFDVKVVGGDITGADSVFISICAIGKEVCKTKVSRANARKGDVVFVTGPHGDSAGGLKLLMNGDKSCEYLIKKHLNPVAQLRKSREIMQISQQDFAMIDSSDGLGDALFKISEAAGVTLDIDFEAVPVSDELKKYYSKEWESLVLWGGEDFELVGCISEQDYKKLDKNHFFKIGRVVERIADKPVIIHWKDNECIINNKLFSKKSFNHFKGNNNG